MKKGFTLLELLVVVVIIGILASVAFPNLTKAIERGRSAEGTNLLGVLRAAQLRYYNEKASFATNTSALDVEYTTPKFFTPALPSTAPSYAEDSKIAKVTRNDTSNPNGYGTYKLEIQVDGNITCAVGTAGSCAKLGY